MGAAKKTVVAIALWENYHLLNVYSTYEIMIACSELFQIVTVGATSVVSTPGAPDCIVDHVIDEKAEDPASLPEQLDYILLPSSDYPSKSGIPNWLKRHQEKGTTILQIDLKATEETTTTGTEEQPTVVIRSGAEWALHLIETKKGLDARNKAAEIVEYSTRVPTDATTTPVGSSNSPRAPNKKKKKEAIGIFLFDGFELLDTFGPTAIFREANRYFKEDSYSFVFFAETKEVQSSKGPLFRVDALLDHTLKCDILLIPGGLGTLSENHNAAPHDRMRQLISEAKQVLSVCSGSGYLAKLGVLSGRKATTNKLLFDLIASWDTTVDWQRTARWVQDGKFWTSSGVSAGTDQALAFLVDQHDDGEACASWVAEQLSWVRVKDATQDVFVAPKIGRLPILLINGIVGLIYGLLPAFLVPKLTTLEKKLGI